MRALARARRERRRHDFLVAEGAALVAVDLVILVALARRSARRPRSPQSSALRGSRARDRARCGRACRPECPAAMSATIACGDSLRGLSSVMTMSSASSAAIAPMIGRLPGSRSPPQPNTTTSRPAQCARAARQRLAQRVGRVRVVDHRERRLRAAEGLHAPGRGAHARQRARWPRSGGRSQSSRTAMTVSRLSTLKSPTSGQISAPGAPARIELELDAARRQLDVHGAHEPGGAARRATGVRGWSRRAARGRADRCASCRPKASSTLITRDMQVFAREQLRLGAP